jgi:1,2-diacylglycerol 3-alpha-glucosyltransferase
VNAHPVLQWMIGPGGRALDLAAPGALANELARLCETPDARAALGRAGRAHCVGSFARDAVVDQILRYYRFVVRYANGPRARLHARAGAAA